MDFRATERGLSDAQKAMIKPEQEFLAEMRSAFLIPTKNPCDVLFSGRLYSKGALH